ncbi:hypothetical protein TNCV_3498761 [Trichonephila clavipes]|nr:hypothetical protein TNCV_3498761 [Trichonephila clavipes]
MLKTIFGVLATIWMLLEITGEIHNITIYDVSGFFEKALDATRGLLATDHVILNHGQVTRMTPELAPPSPNYHATPTGGHFSSRQIQRASLPYTAGL